MAIIIAKYIFKNSENTLPTFNSGYTYNYTDVDNGDGTITRTITSDSLPTSISFEDESGLVSLSKLRTDRLTTMQYMFDNCEYLVSIDVSGFDTSNVTNFHCLFNYCKRLTSIVGLDKWDTRLVTNMRCMFQACESLTELNGIHNWNTSNVQYLEQAFDGCKELTILNLHGWDTGSVNATNAMQSTFDGCSKLKFLDINNWTLGRSGTMADNTFSGCDELMVVNTGNSTWLSTIINCLPTRSSNKPGIITGANLTDTHITAASAKNWNTAKYLAATYIYNESYNNADGVPNLPINWNTNYVYTIHDTNNGDGTVTRSLVSDNVPNYTQAGFRGEEGLIKLYYLDTRSIKYMTQMFRDCTNLEYVNAAWDTSGVSSMDEMFYFTSVHTIIGIENFNTSNVTEMNHMFMYANVTSLDLSNWNVSNVTNMERMFDTVSDLQTLNLSGWDMSKVTNTLSLFDANNVLKTIIMKNCSIDTIDKIIDNVITRKNFRGTIKTGAVEATSVNYTLADSKNWDVVDDIIAKYTFNSSTDTLPAFNEGYVYTYTDVNNGNGTTTRTIISDTLPTSISFSGKTGLLSVTKLKIDNLTNLDSLFYGCTNLTAIEDINTWNTGGIRTTIRTFQDCSKLTSLDLSNWDVSKITDSRWMFYKCSNLTTLDLSGCDGWNTANTLNSFMFDGCGNLNLVVLEEVSISTINFIIGGLPTKTVKSPGTIKTNSIMGKVNSYGKYWNIESDITFDNIVAKYTANAYIGCTFNTGFEYTIKDSVNPNGTITRLITSNGLPTSIKFRDDGIINTMKIDELNTDNVTDMNHMFFHCASLSSLDLSNLDVSNVTNMNSMFSNCTKLTTIEGLDTWDTGSVTNMDQMFYIASLSTETLKGVENWDVSNVENMNAIFSGCDMESLDLSKWDVGRLAVFRDMFKDCVNLTSLNLSNWDTKRANNLIGMFQYCNKLTTIEGLDTWDTSNVTTMNYMFDGCTSLTTLDLSSWNISKISSGVSSLFRNCTNLTTLKLNNFNITTYIESNVFANCNKLTLIDMTDNDVSSINKIINILPTRTAEKYGVIMVYDFDPSINKSTANSKYWNVFAPIAKYVFNNSDTLPTFNEGFSYRYSDIIDGDNTTRTIFAADAPTSVSFKNKNGLISLSKLNTSNLTSMEDMFYFCSNLTNINLKDWDTSKVTNMKNVFQSCKKITSLDLSNWDTHNVTTMQYLFGQCSNLTSLNLSGWDTSNVTNIGSMFFGCSNLTSLDLSNFNTSKVTDMGYMFYNCSKLTSIDLSSFNTSDVSNMYQMFYGCNSLTSLDLSNFDTSKVDNMVYMFIGCTSLVSVDVSNFNLKESAYINPEGLFANSPMLKIIKANNCNLYTLNLILRGLPTVIGGKGIVYKLNDNEWCDKINTVTIESKNWKVCLRPGYHKKNITIGERYL